MKKVMLNFWSGYVRFFECLVLLSSFFFMLNITYYLQFNFITVGDSINMQLKIKKMLYFSFWSIYTFKLLNIHGQQ